MNTYFDAGHHAYMENRSGAFASFVLDRVWSPAFASFKTCIELGAGTGRFTPPLADRFERLHLVEPAPSYADALEKRFASEHVSVSAQPAEEFLEAWPSNEPVLLSAFHLLHHLTLEQRQTIYTFLKRTGSQGLFVEPNPWNPLILLQVLVTPGMHFAEERQYLRLTKRRVTTEVAEAGLTVSTYRRIVAMPPGVADQLLQRGLEPVVAAAEGLTAMPCAASYHAFHIVP